MSKDDFVAKYLDETVGLLLASFSAAEKSHHIAPDSYAMDGKFFIGQQKRAKALLGRMYDELKPQANGAKK